MADPLDALRAALADRYRIDREIGRGGMATVYLAEDLRHGRQVAIKVLDPQLAAVIGPERFLREIRIAARLTHPHILPVHDSGAEQGLLYYVMPHVEGESLRARLDRERQLPIPEAIRLTTEVARALDHAHAKGVVHRDIKPENILLASGQAVLADFGIAQSLEPTAGGERLTEPGLAVGTPDYMSPEQTTGAKIDGRSDLYSLGCVLYEMVAGQPPFTGATAEIVVHQHMLTPPRPVNYMRPTVPAALGRVIETVLAKSPADRFQTGAAFAQALEAVSAASTSELTYAASPALPVTTAVQVQKLPVDPHGTTVAIRATRPRPPVLVLVSVAAIVLLAAGWLAWTRGWLPHGAASQLDPNRRAWVLVADFDAPDSTLAAAVKDLIGTALDQSTIVRPVPLRGIQEALAAAGKPRNARVNAELAHELAYRRSVRAIVSGSITRAGRTYVVTARAEDVDSARVIATATEVAKNDDALIPAAARIGATLRRRLGEATDAVIATRPLNLIRTPSFEAFQLFLTARRLEQVNGDFRAAVELYRRATLLDPEFAVAWVSLATAKSNAGDRDSAIVFCRHGLEFPSRLTDAQRYSSEGLLAFFEDDIPRSVNLTQQAVELGNLTARGNLANRLSALGRIDEALAIFRELQHDAWSSGTAAAYNEWGALLCLNRSDEASRLSAGFPPPRSKFAPADNALVAERWDVADSLGSHLLGDESEDPGTRWEGGMVAVGAKAARGAVTRARADLDRVLAQTADSPDEKRWTLYMGALMDLLGGRSADPNRALAPADTGEAWRSYLAFAHAAAGDTSRARALIVRLRGGAPRWEARLFIALAEGLIDSRAGRYQRVVDQLGPTARSRLYESRLPVSGTTYAIRWVVADAFERLAQPDSAAVYYELAREPGRFWDVDWYARAVTLPHALRRLVVLDARAGRLAQAEKRGQELDRLVTRPDDEFRPLLAQAQTELAGAKARAGAPGH